MVVWWAISVYNQSVIFPFSLTDVFFRGRRTRSNIPSRREDQEIGKRACEVTGLGRQDAEDRGINVINRDGADIDEFGHIIFIRNLS